METRGEVSELEQLVSSDVEGENEDSSTLQSETVVETKIVSPVRSNKISSSGNTSRSSISRSVGRPKVIQNAVGGGSRILYINEKKARETNKPTTARPRTQAKDSQSTSNTNLKHHCFLSEVPDVRHMEKALLGLLEDFHSGKLKAFGSGCTMEQMTNIREQQEKLAKLHFDLSGALDPSLSAASLRRSQSTMSQLIQRLEQLSVSIEGLHNNTQENAKEQ